MRNLKDIIIERLVISKNKPSQDISWEEFCKALANYSPRKNAKNFTIFVKNTGITDDIYVNSNYRRNTSGKAKDKLIYIAIIKGLNTNVFRRLSVAVVTDGYNKPTIDDPDCFIIIETFDDFKGLFGEKYVEVMREFYNTAMKKQQR